VAFNLWLPAGTPPAGGWPVAICGHGSNVAKNYCFGTAAVLTSHRIAVIAPNAMGHGGGPRTTMTVGLRDGRSTTVAAPGLGYDADGDGQIARGSRTRGTAFHRAQYQARSRRRWPCIFRHALQTGVDVDGTAPATWMAQASTTTASRSAVATACRCLRRAGIRAVFVAPPGTMIYNALSPPFRARFAPVLAARSPSI
jgi:hypothetical protein